MGVLGMMLRGADALPYDASVSGSLHVGTSGFSFPDWVGTVYPQNARAADFLRHYAEWFDAVEVNSTYYRIPTPQAIEAMRRKAPAGFTFTVKLPQEMTHQRERAAKAVAPFLHAIAPLRSADQLGAVLAQFPFSFKRAPESERHIERIAEPFREADIPIVVEFRHDSWHDDTVFERLRGLGVGFVNVDLPALPALPRPSSVVTSGVGYIRLHGRNAATWWEHPTPSDRYDYLYDDGELEAWAQRIETVAKSAKRTFVFNNNCHLGQSVVNALQLHQRLGLPRPGPSPGGSAPLLPQTTAELVEGMCRRIASARRGASSTASA